MRRELKEWGVRGGFEESGKGAGWNGELRREIKERGGRES